MSIMIAPRSMYPMSVLIGVCDKDICMFVSDSRQSLNNDDGTYTAINEQFKKIHRINDNLIVGGVGFFYVKETAITPFVGVDTASLTTDSALSLIIDYLTSFTKEKILPGSRTYLIGGFNDDGNLSQYTVTCHYETAEIETNKHSFPKNSTGGVVVPLLPPRLRSMSQYYVDKINGCVVNCHGVDDYLGMVSDVISEIAEADNTVNKTVQWSFITCDQHNKLIG